MANRRPDDGPTVRQVKIRAALSTMPRGEKEPLRQWYKRIAEAAGVSVSYVQTTEETLRCEAIGRKKREEELAAKITVPALPEWGVGPPSDFSDWATFFFKLKILAARMGNFANETGAVYARAFLEEVENLATRAEKRARMSPGSN